VWLVTFGCCAAGLLVTLTVTRPLTLAILARGAAFALTCPLGYATIGLVLSLRRPANPIGWLYAASGLASSLGIPLDPWVTQLAGDGRPVPLAAQVGYVVVQPLWALASRPHTIHPGEAHSPVTASRYGALSYRWGCSVAATASWLAIVATASRVVRSAGSSGPGMMTR
jgi:hypothetical protein